MRDSFWPRPRGVSGHVCWACLYLAAPRSASADPAGWDPGKRTAAELPGAPTAERFRGSGDGVYGRFAGDITFALGAGAELGDGSRAALLTRALFYHTAGVTAGYVDALGGERELTRALDFGLEVRPLFLPRWALDGQSGSALLDLTLDSLALGAGASFGQLNGQEFSKFLGVQATLGFGVPLFGNAEGLWLEARGTYRSELPGNGLSGTVLLSVYESWASPLID